MIEQNQPTRLSDDSSHLAAVLRENQLGNIPAHARFREPRTAPFLSTSREGPGSLTADERRKVQPVARQLDGVKMRKIKPFSEIDMYSTIPQNLSGQFHAMTRSIERELQQQRDFVHVNKEMVSDPEKVKLSQRARLLHRYRAER